jgi:dTDP-4-dehydrorhamnose reductase
MNSRERTVSIIGSNGMLAHAVRALAPSGIDLLLHDLPELDITDREQVIRCLRNDQPEVVINCAAYTQVDKCEDHRDDAYAVNGQAPGYLAQAACEIGACLIHISTDFVFAGDKNTPYLEEDPVGPLSVYGASKLAGEQAIITGGLKDYYILRTSWLYGPGGPNFVETITRLAGERDELGIVADQVGSPTYAFDLAQAIWRLVEQLTATDRAPFGLYHYSNLGECSWHGFACEIVNQLRKKGCPVKAQKIKPIRTEDYPVPASRPQHSVLSKKKYINATGADVPEWKDSLRSYFENRS